MYIFIALFAAVCYSFDNVLMAKIYRSMDRLSAVGYRGLALAITMAPLLFFVPGAKFMAGVNYLHIMVLACLVTALANTFAAMAVNYLPVGLVGALGMSTSTLVATVVGFYQFNQRPSPQTLGIILLLLATITALGASQPTSEPRHWNYRKGIPCAVGFGLLVGLGFSGVAVFSSVSHPFLGAYLWEAGIGVCAFLYACIRGLFKGAGFERVDLRRFGSILLRCAPTVGGTGGYAMAATLGTLSVVAAVISTETVTLSILAYLLYKEILSRRQWALIVLISLLVAGLKVAG